VFLLLFVLLAAAAADHIPLAALAGVLAVVAWNMVERQAVATLLRVSTGDAAVLATTFFLTIFRDLTEAIVVGFAMGAMLFIHRMSTRVAVSGERGVGIEDRADAQGLDRIPYRDDSAGDRDIAVYRISGAFFFGAAASIGSVLDNIGEAPKALVVDFAAVPLLDSTAAHIIEGLAHKCARDRVRLFLTGTNHDMRQTLFALGVKPPLARYEKSVEKAVADLRRPAENA
jgi:SulP family sulfate permease